MPPECPPGAAVTIQQLDGHTWIVKHQVPDTAFKIITVPGIEHLPDDPEQEEIEARLAREVATRLPEPE
jgi:hypothetical protein